MLRLLSIATLVIATKYARCAEICCANIGCFTDDPPYNGQPLPQCIESFNPAPSFTMYTRSNRLIGQTFTHNGPIPSVFSAARRTVFAAHGWQSSGSTQWLRDLKDAFLDREDINVVVVDWEGGAGLLNYPQSAANTRSMGAYTALHFDNLVSSGGASDSRLWCTGHSLGAHMCGHAGMRTQLQRNTGMDPAGPWFEGSLDRTVGLNPTSGRFVDVIHTDITYGTLRDLGHIDYYPAGGKDQPGCADLKVQPVAQDNKDVLGCSHGRATDYMIQSVISDCFLSRDKCTDYNNLPGSCSTCTCGASPCGVMGYGADNACHTTGWFYVPISPTEPYCTS